MGRLRTAQQAAGFSLIELLVVLLIIGFGVGMLSVSVGGQQSLQLRLDAKNFANNLSLLTEEAVLARQQWGVDFYRQNDAGGVEQFGYRWLLYEDEHWQPAELPGIAEAEQLPASVQLLLTLEGSEVLINDKKPYIQPTVVDGVLQKVTAEKSLLPDIFIFSSGEMTSFTLTLRELDEDESNSREYRILGDALGRIKLLKPGEDDEL